RLLNDRFDATDRRIRVYDTHSLPDVVVYPNAEIRPIELPVMIYPQWLYYCSGFTVEIPLDYANSDIENQIIRTINIYKFTGTYYQILYNE
ncbi:MAG: hypothetical protein PHQ33_03190, partial [Bacteroidales bacterium]|nr:hypothetical protein [Bacteroidales bacterium]